MKPKSNYIDKEQFNKIIDHVPSLRIRKWRDADVQMSMKIAYYCALRYGSEVADLTKEDFDYERHEVYLGQTKTRKNDYGVLPQMFVQQVQEYWSTKQPLEPVLKDCSAQNLYKWLMQIGSDLQIDALLAPQSITGEKTKMHIFRKSMLKDMMYGTYGKSANIGQVQSMARHKKATTTADYLKLDIEGSKEYWDDIG